MESRSRSELWKPQHEAGGKRGGNHRAQKSSSFNGRGTTATATGTSEQKQEMLRRPKTQPDLFAACSGEKKMMQHLHPLHCRSETERSVPAKMLVKVDVQRVLGPVQVMASTAWRVEDLVAASVNQYAKECRRPLLPNTDPKAFALHYSQFSLECLDPKEKLIGLGSRNFFLCLKSTTVSTSPSTSSSAANESPSKSCYKDAKNATKIAIPWPKFIGVLF